VHGRPGGTQPYGLKTGGTIESLLAPRQQRHTVPGRVAWRLCEGAAVLPCVLTIRTGDLDIGDLQGKDTGERRGRQGLSAHICGKAEHKQMRACAACWVGSW